MSNLFYDGFFNLQYVNSDYYHQNQEQIAQYEQKQSEEIQNVVKAVHDLCKAVKNLIHRISGRHSVRFLQ